jgi:bifunctional enzyme CysN/CysC
MRDSGVVVLVALVSPFRSDRESAATLFAKGDFIEVFVDTPVEVCSQRDPKGLYAKAAAGNLPNMTGVGQVYEPPITPDLILRGTGDVEASADLLVAAVLEA